MKNELLDKLNTLISEEDLISNIKEVNQVKHDFDDWLLKEEGKQQVAQLKAKDEGKDIELEDFSIYKEQFYLSYSKYKELRKKQIEIKNQLEEENLKQKNALIGELKAVVENEENIGSAFKSFKTIQETWKKIGDIPRPKRDSVQKEYSRLRELFFYNINIYRDLKEHDYKRNGQLKEKVIFNLQTLRNSESQIREIEKHLRLYQDEWEDIGPVNNQDWESLKTSYWEAVRSIYDKINKHYDEYRQIQNENLNKKRKIIESLHDLIQKLVPEGNLRDWNKNTNEVKNFQAEWKKIGFASKKDNDKIWKEFRGLCNEFFNLRKEFFKSRDEVDQKSRNEKNALIEKAKKLKESEDWSNTTKEFIQIQKQWKTVPNAGRYERGLWEEFRTICDEFFNRKEETSKEHKKSLEDNLKAKKKAIDALKNKKLTPDFTEQDVKEEIASFVSIGPVKKDYANQVLTEYSNLIKDKLKGLKINSEQIELTVFQFKMDSYALMENKQDIFFREKNALKKKISSLENEVFQAENNLGYFSISKGAEKLFEQINKKNEDIKDEIALLKRQIKMIPNE